MQVSLTLKAEKLVSINDVLFIEYVRIAKLFHFVIEVDKGRWALSYLGNVLKELLNRAIYSDCHFYHLTLLSFDRVKS